MSSGWELLADALLPWYEANARSLPWRDTKDPYRIWISEIMLQQTRVEAVRAYYARFMDALPGVPDLAACPEDRLLKLWEGLGYYSRARNLKKAAIQIMEQYNGSLPADHAALLKLPGIGPYTAGAIASIAFDIPVPAVDGNVLRVRARAFGDASDIADQKVKKTAEAELSSFLCLRYPDASRIPAANPPEPVLTGQNACITPGAFNQALMDLGATVCLPNGMPLCGRCPWQMLCKAYLDDRVRELPVRQKKKPRRIEDRTVFLIMDGDRLVLQKRPEKGLLAGLYELPNVPGHLTEREALEHVRSFGITEQPSSVSNAASNTNPGLIPLYIRKLEPAKHIFTHIEWHMTGYLIRVDSLSSESAGLLFAEQEDVRDRYSIPSAFDPYLRHLKQPYCP